ncbi:MAG TPA: hypothetical protein VH701_20070 [Vicinamibacterales bacterium]
MKRTAYLTLVLAFVLGVLAAAAQESASAKSQTAIGSVKSVSGASFVLDAANKEMSFNVDENTYILAKGAGTKTRAKRAAGQGGLTIADVVHQGDGVVVKFVNAGRSFLATEIEVRNPRPASALPVK